MTSPSTSKIASVKDLHLSFEARYYLKWSLRDKFIQTLKRPKSLMEDDSVKIEVLKGLNFDIHAGERVGLIGVNGAGKTTLCKVMSGYFRPQQGSVEVSGTVRSVFDTSVGIYPELTGRENAEILAKLLYPHRNPDEIVQDVLQFADLGKFIDLPFKSYSSGMQARLCLSAISCEPSDLMILDEVFEGADKFFSEKMAKRITHIIERSGAVLFVSHSMQRILKICNRLIVLNNGQIIFDGDPISGIEAFDRAVLSQA
jgi:ABC-type polysaccharide/polyol phosphate transport system ATPase subunit